MLTRIQNVLLQINTKNYYIICVVKRSLSIINRIKLIRRIKQNNENQYVIIGITDDSLRYKKILDRYNKLWGITCISAQQKNDSIECREYTELLYEDTHKFVFLLFEDMYTIRTKGILLEMGVLDSQIIVMNHVSNGGRLFEAYDVSLGLCWPAEDGGFVTFENNTCDIDTNEDIFTIVTLGGSTTDPYNANIKSWPEFLWEKLSKMGIRCRVINGGVCSYTVTQEWIKLYRDVLTLKPDLVISYSGVNDFLQEGYYVDKHYFSLRYMVDNIRTSINKRQIRNDMQTGNVINQCALGIESDGDIPDHWVKCQKLMKSVCNEFNVSFIGYLQPYNENDANVNSDMREKYNKASHLVHELGSKWLIDMTSMFDGKKGLFWDRCHVYEKGNELIAQTILKDVIRLKNEDKK